MPKDNMKTVGRGLGALAAAFWVLHERKVDAYQAQLRRVEPVVEAAFQVVAKRES